ncbi:hypothetical protein D9M69_648680 [compost metagenome]
MQRWLGGRRADLLAVGVFLLLLRLAFREDHFAAKCQTAINKRNNTSKIKCAVGRSKAGIFECCYAVGKVGFEVKAIEGERNIFLPFKREEALTLSLR